MRSLILAAAAALAIGGCATAPPGDFCTTAQPQRPSAGEISAMSPERKREVLAHNRFGAQACGWRP